MLQPEPPPPKMAPCSPIAMIPVCSLGGVKVMKGPWASKVSLGLGVTQILLGILLIIAQIVLIAVYSLVGVVGIGIPCGIFAPYYNIVPITYFIITGCFAVAAGKKRSTCLIVTVMVLSILSAVFTVLIFSFSSVGTVVDKQEYVYRRHSWSREPMRCECVHDYPDYMMEPEPQTTTETQNVTSRMPRNDTSGMTNSSDIDYMVDPMEQAPKPGQPMDLNSECQMICPMQAYSYYTDYGMLRLVLSMHGIMLVLAMIELVLAVIASCLCCRAVCSCCSDKPDQLSYAIPMGHPAYSTDISTLMTSPAVLHIKQPGDGLMAVPLFGGGGPLQGEEPDACIKPPSYTSLSLHDDQPLPPVKLDII